MSLKRYKPQQGSTRGARCTQCRREMLSTPGCSLSSYTGSHGRKYPRIKWGDESGPGYGGGRCGDCGCLPKHYHHVGCDIERCPKCHNQALSCDCFDAELRSSRRVARPRRAAKSSKKRTIKSKKSTTYASTARWTKGSMHRALGIPKGKKISTAALKRAMHRPGIVGKRARKLLNVRGVKTGSVS